MARSDINSVRNLYHIAWAVRPYIAFAIRQIYRVAKQHIDKTRFIELFEIDAEAIDHRCRPERRAKPGVEGSTHYRAFMQ